MSELMPLERECRQGVLAFGDSITNAGGELQWGVAMHSWALWVARGLGVPFTSFAVDGALAADVARVQIRAFEQRSARPHARYDLGCLYIGVNDVAAPQWDAEALERDFREAVRFLSERCDRVLTVTAPLDLGRPRATARVIELNSIVKRCAAEAGLLVVDLRDLRARNLVMADHIHPTAFGQIAIAERALSLLARNGLTVRVRPSSLIAYETTWWRRLRADARYLYRHARVSSLALAKLLEDRRGRDRGGGAGREGESVGGRAGEMPAKQDVRRSSP